MKYILLALFLCSLGFANAQSIIAEHDTVSYKGTVDDFIAIDNHYTNKTGNAQRFTWVREQQLPAGWETTVCDKEVCWSSNTSTSTLAFGFEVANNEETFVKVNFFPNGLPGTGVVKLKYFLKGTMDTITSWYIATAEASTGVTKVAAVKDVTLYPTPARDVVNVMFGNIRASKIEIYNVLGQRVKTVPVQLERNMSKVEIPLSDLDKGIYFLRLYSSNTGAVITRQFTKE